MGKMQTTKLTASMVSDYEIDEEWMNAPLGPFVGTGMDTKPVVTTETENMRHKQQNVVSTPQGPDLQQYTPKQVDNYCEKVLDKCLFISLDEAVKLLTDSVQIIRQLQAEAGMVANHQQTGDRRS